MTPEDAAHVRAAAFQSIKGTADDDGNLDFNGLDMTDGRDRRRRKENGLVELTKKFKNLLKEAEN